MKIPKQSDKPMKVPVTPVAAPQIPPAYLAMAAAHMDKIGKLMPAVQGAQSGG